MGVVLDHNHRYTEEEREYLRERGREYLIPANERRFGTNEEPRDPEPHEQHDNHAVSPFYNSEARQAAVYDVGGAPLPNTVLDYNTGRVADRNDGTFVEYSGPGHTPGAYDLREGAVREPEGFSSYSDDEGDVDIDEDIATEVVNVKNKTELQKRLKSEGVDYESDDSREELENKLAIALQDKRNAEKS